MEHVIHTGQHATPTDTQQDKADLAAALDKATAKIRAAGINRAQMEVVREVITDLLLGEPAAS